MILGPPNLPRYLVFLIYTSDDFHKNLAKKGRVIMLPVLDAMTAVLEAIGTGITARRAILCQQDLDFYAASLPYSLTRRL